QVARRLTAGDGLTAPAQTKVTLRSIQYLDKTAARARLIHDNARVGVEIFLQFVTEKQRFVVGVLVLDGKSVYLPETEFFVKRLRLGIVVQHTQVHIAADVSQKVIGEVAQQQFTNAWLNRLRIYRK